MKINKHILPNGLRLVHYQDLSTQMVALNIVYDVGAPGRRSRTYRLCPSV